MLGVVVVVENVKPFYEHALYHVEVALPAVQELIAPPLAAAAALSSDEDEPPDGRVHCDTSSPEDIAVTEQLIEAGKLLDIELLDHLVIGILDILSLQTSFNPLLSSF